MIRTIRICTENRWRDDVTMPVVDSLGEEFLDYVKDGMLITIGEDGNVTVE